MAAETPSQDVFRFTQLRPRRARDDTASIELAADTVLAGRLLGLPDAQQRASMANDALATSPDIFRSIDDLPMGPEISAAVEDLRGREEATTGSLIERLPAPDTRADSDTFEQGRRALSDTLLAAYFATRGFAADLGALHDAYRVYHLLERDRRGESDRTLALGRFLRQRLLVPSVPVATVPATSTLSGGATGSPGEAQAVADLTAAIDELAVLDRPDLLVLPDRDGMVGDQGMPFTLTGPARHQVSSGARSLLQARHLDLAATPIDVAIERLWAERARLTGGRLSWPRPDVTTEPGASLPPPPAHAVLRPAGVAELLVVKQQLKRYEAGEIAHVENVLRGEKKSRAHRRLDRSEETFLEETELTRAQETELETADRFELTRESARTVQRDRQIGFGLSLSGKYGPSVEFSSNLEMETSTSQQESTRNASSYARDVVSRSVERLTERVRELRSRTVVRETEETNLHELHNEGDGHLSGVYQFIDKVYELQVFNYGVRQIFDFMVPEPASFLWHIERNPSLDVDLPPPPEDLDALAPSAAFVKEHNAFALAATFGATDIEAPPPLYRLIVAGVSHGEDNANESGQPRGWKRLEVQVPVGYRPLRARIRGLAFTDNAPVIGVVIGSQRALWRPAGGDRLALSGGRRLAHQPEIFLALNSEPFELTEGAKLDVGLLAYETAIYSLDVVIVVRRTEAELNRWRLATYRKIRAAYEDRVRDYEQRVEVLRAEAEERAQRESRQPFGAPPAANSRTVAMELKKHCISIITQQRFDAFDALKEGTPPFFDFVEAAEEGAYIRFFEQAFEWDQLQYVFYPYFWARKSSWVARFTKQDVDPQFLEFLRAGSARVVVPVRPGFEEAVAHFLETGKLWGGEGEPPQIHSPQYVSIIDEIRERTGASQGEVPVGEPWDTRVPTALVVARDRSDLPAWERMAPDEWRWQPMQEG